MKARLAVVTLLCACLLSGCMRAAHLYPVQGPLATQTPPPIYTGRLTGLINSGSISVKLADGQQFSGQWHAESAGALAKESRAGVVPPFNLSAEWDAVYGPGFYTAHVLGAHLFARTTLTGKQGGALQMEMISQPVETPTRRMLRHPISVALQEMKKGTSTRWHSELSPLLVSDLENGGQPRFMRQTEMERLGARFSGCLPGSKVSNRSSVTYHISPTEGEM